MAAGERREAERLLREAKDQAEAQGRILLAAAAERDLARLLDSAGRKDEAREVAQTARNRFEKLGARVEVRKLEEFIAG